MLTATKTETRPLNIFQYPSNSMSLLIRQLLFSIHTPLSITSKICLIYRLRLFLSRILMGESLTIFEKSSSATIVIHQQSNYFRNHGVFHNLPFHPSTGLLFKKHVFLNHVFQECFQKLFTINGTQLLANGNGRYLRQHYAHFVIKIQKPKSMYYSVSTQLYDKSVKKASPICGKNLILRRHPPTSLLCFKKYPKHGMQARCHAFHLDNPHPSSDQFDVPSNPNASLEFQTFSVVFCLSNGPNLNKSTANPRSSNTNKLGRNVFQQLYSNIHSICGNSDVHWSTPLEQATWSNITDLKHQPFFVNFWKIPNNLNFVTVPFFVVNKIFSLMEISWLFKCGTKKQCHPFNTDLIKTVLLAVISVIGSYEDHMTPAVETGVPESPTVEDYVNCDASSTSCAGYSTFFSFLDWISGPNSNLRLIVFSILFFDFF